MRRVNAWEIAMSDSDLLEKNTFLIILRLGVDERYPLGKQSTKQPDLLPVMESGKQYALIAALLNPDQQKTRTPLTPIMFYDDDPEDKKAIYNLILRRFQELTSMYYDSPDGFVSEPDRFTRRRQEHVSTLIGLIGRGIYELFPRNTPLMHWFDEMLLTGSRTEGRHVTIITNDFNIPWYWMRAKETSKLLCERCPIGLLQLANQNIAEFDRESYEPPLLNSQEALRALLINGSHGLDLPFVEEELKELELFLQKRDRQRPLRNLAPLYVENSKMISTLWQEEDDEIIRGQFRLVHYSGHWHYDSQDDKKIQIGDRQLAVRVLKDFIDSAVLVLDGCSSSRGLQAWSDVENLTGRLLNLGALGCIVTPLPVKNDPIVSKVFWEAFYEGLLTTKSPSTLGQALVKGREALKNHFKNLDSPNPTWAFYQLIGNPSIRLMDD
jgi:CHAT domain-containing protein